jgi:mono/diheme cytochrome c family protein
MNLKLMIGVFIVGLTAGLVPFGLIALARSQPSPHPPVHPIQDLFKQQKFHAQQGDSMFADGRAMRPRLDDVTAATDLTINNEIVNDPDDPHMIGNTDAPIDLKDELTYQRVVDGTEPQADGKPGFVKKFPVKVSMDLLERGRERYTIYCAACHGQAGYGDGIVALRAAELQTLGNAKWVAPKNYHSDDMRQQPVGRIYNTIAHGVRTMPAYGKQVSVLDRWAIVAYVKALQRSQHAEPNDMPKAEKDKIQ